MRYNNLGKAGIKVSELSFGSWLTFGGNLNTDGAKAILRRAFELGVNYFDNAEGYANGASEQMMGEALSDFRRQDLVISTKIFWGGEGPNDTGLSWKHLVEGTKASLRRLNMDYVDLLFCHRPDHSTPVEETVRAMDHLVRAGLVFYWGTSEWPAERIEEAYQIAKDNHCVPPSMEQPEYNLLVRERVELEYQPLYAKYKMGTTVWSPLASGILTGKYLDGLPKGSRLDQQSWLRDRLTDEVMQVTRELNELAKELNCSLAQLSIAWCLKNRNVSTVIFGATSERQLEENLSALQVKDKLSTDVMARIAQIIAVIKQRSELLESL
jgi:voltage-dependent potassium channel beta subunit